MIKVLIADDEHLVRQLLKNCIDWEAVGLEIVAEAASAIEGLDLMEIHNPDLVITDICMPQMDGIAFSQELRERYPHVKIVLLTGHEEFEYAHRGIKVGVDEYILKPIDDEEILKVATQLKTAILQEHAQQEEFADLKHQLEANEYLYGDAHVAPTLSSLQKNGVDQYIFFVKAGLIEEARQQLQRFFEGNPSTENPSTENPSAENPSAELLGLDNLRAIACNLVSRLYTLLAELEIPKESVFLHESQPFEQVFRLNTLPALKAYLDELTERSTHQTRTKKINKVSSLAGSVKAYLQEHYNDPELSLSLVAQRFHVNSSYLSRLFKEELGETFIAFLTRCRMESAIELLQETDLRAYEIAEKVGISDPHYFSVAFKKYTKQSVTEYRNRSK